MIESWRRLLMEATVTVVLCAAVAFPINALLHPRGIALIADAPYEVMVPCPEPTGKVTVPAVAASDERLSRESTFIVDARDAAAYKAWHPARAKSVPYDYLEPTAPQVLDKLARAIAASRAQLVAVYGDGDDPDTGEQLAKEITLKGIKRVYFIKGGARALRGTP